MFRLIFILLICVQCWAQDRYYADVPDTVKRDYIRAYRALDYDSCLAADPINIYTLYMRAYHDQTEVISEVSTDEDTMNVVVDVNPCWNNLTEDQKKTWLTTANDTWVRMLVERSGIFAKPTVIVRLNGDDVAKCYWKGRKRKFKYWD